MGGDGELQGRVLGAEKPLGKAVLGEDEQNLEESCQDIEVTVTSLGVQTWAFTAVASSVSHLSRTLGEILRTPVATPFFIQRRPWYTQSPAQVTPSNGVTDDCFPKSSPSLGLHIAGSG